MKKKKTILILTFALIILVMAGFYIFNRESVLVNPKENNIPYGTGPQDERTIAGKKQLVTDDFSMELPTGWSKTIDTMTGVSAMATNPDEIINDAAAQKINFKSYLAVSSDTLNEKTIKEYMQSVKDEIQMLVPDAIFANENVLTINERPARAMEAEMMQQGINFKVLMVTVQGNGNDVWIMSYNTTKNSWDGYKEDFSDSAKSFTLKK